MTILLVFTVGALAGALVCWAALRRDGPDGAQLAGQVLERFTAELRTLEVRDQGRDDLIGHQLTEIARSHERLSRETQALSVALRRPGVRGRYGESTLRNVVEAAGLSRHADFSLQEHREAEGDNRAIRPDMTIRLPGDGIVAVDAKAPMDHFLDSLEADTPAQRDALLDRHAVAVRGHMRSLATKSYWRHFERAPQFVVMFMPSESLFAAALERDPGLLDQATRSRVVLVTPATMVALLRVVAFGWQERQLAEGAQRVRRLAGELIERLDTVLGHLGKTSRSLDGAVRAHNAAVGSFESRLLVTARRMGELGIDGAGELPEAEPVLTEVRC